MPEIAEANPHISWADCNVWIIDDDIPIEQAEFADDAMKMGLRPIDHGTLLYLLGFENWTDNHLRALCDQLLHNAGCVTGFRFPDNAFLYLENGALIPDVIVFDWEYAKAGTGKIDPVVPLERILSRCVSAIQVYTKDEAIQVAEALKRLTSQYSVRLGEVRTKPGTKAEDLLAMLKGRLANSLSARLATKIRRSSSAAVEDVLVKIDDLPLNVAVNMLVAGQAEAPKELELVEMLSIKVGEALESAEELDRALAEFAVQKGIPNDRVRQAAREIVALLSADVRRHIQYDGKLLAQINSAWKQANQGQAKQDGDKTNQIVKEFFAFRLYDRPNDELVRTGDIVILQTSDKVAQDPPNLYLVITPPCDLVRFWQKTRACLTLVRMYPVKEDRGLTRTWDYGNRGFQVGSSINAKHPMILPSVPTSDSVDCGRDDYVLFAYELHYEYLGNTELAKAQKKELGRPLTYSELGKKLTRTCRISEPFLGGILAELSGILFRPGLPDYPDEEKKRLADSFPQQGH